MIKEIIHDVIVQRLCKETSVACSIYRERRRSPEKCCHFRHFDGQNFPQSGRSMGSVQDYVSVTLNRPNTRLCSAKRRRRSLFTTIAVSAVHGARIREDRRRRSPFSRFGHQHPTKWPLDGQRSRLLLRYFEPPQHTNPLSETTEEIVVHNARRMCGARRAY